MVNIAHPCKDTLIFTQETWDRIHSTPEGKTCPKFDYCNRWINPKNAESSTTELEQQRRENGGKLFLHDKEE